MTSGGRSDGSRLLIEAGRKFGVLSLRGSQHAILQNAAQAHADYQARLGRQGHQRWDARSQRLATEARNLREICAESWPWDSAEEAADEMFHSWRQSPGHWAVANGPCDCWGYAMALNEPNNVWYACAILGDRA